MQELIAVWDQSFGKGRWTILVLINNVTPSCQKPTPRCFLTTRQLNSRSTTWRRLLFVPGITPTECVPTDENHYERQEKETTQSGKEVITGSTEPGVSLSFPLLSDVRTIIPGQVRRLRLGYLEPCKRSDIRTSILTLGEQIQ